MIPVYQTRFGGSSEPGAEQGNCMAACLASVFECSLEDVPDFSGNITNGKWLPVLERWLAERGLGFIQVLPSGDFTLPGIHLQARKSTTLKNPDDGHMVVVKGREVIHDPNPNARELGAPEEYWVFVSLDPAKGGIP